MVQRSLRLTKRISEKMRHLLSLSLSFLSLKRTFNCSLATEKPEDETFIQGKSGGNHKGKIDC